MLSLSLSPLSLPLSSQDRVLFCPGELKGRILYDTYLARQHDAFLTIRTLEDGNASCKTIHEVVRRWLSATMNFSTTVSSRFLRSSIASFTRPNPSSAFPASSRRTIGNDGRRGRRVPGRLTHVLFSFVNSLVFIRTNNRRK